MSLIKISTNSIAWLLGGDRSTNSYFGPFCESSGSSGPRGFNYSSSNSKLRIFKGALPSQNDINTIGPTLLRTTDLLINFAISNWTCSSTSAIVTLTIPTPTSATESGVASWFAISSYETTLATSNQFLVGEITLPGGGGELVINDLNIVSGQTYSLGSISFEFPSTFSYP